MMKILYSNKKADIEEIDKIINRGVLSFDEFFEPVSEIINNIRKDKDKALAYYTEKFDNFKLNERNYFFDKHDFEEAYNSIDERTKDILDTASERIRNYHENQKLKSWVTFEDNGTILGQKITPIEKVALYVPGGKALYPSTVLMTGIPAKVAGVDKIFIASPVYDKEKAKTVLAAAHIIGAEKLYKIGGAQAIAALSFGTELIEKVDKIVGPGNIYVTVAKKLLFGNIDIDMVAGPSEILIIADKFANPDFIVQDLFSQAEHDELASSLLVTDSENLAKKVKEKIHNLLKTAERSSIIKKSLENNGAIIVTSSIEEAVQISNNIAPEHLEILTKEPFEVLPIIKNAGAIFLGEYSPEPVGDYMAGPNHVLPTSGTAKFFSPLGVYDFYKKSSIISLSKQAFDNLENKIADFAKLEGLFSHGDSIKVRR